MKKQILKINSICDSLEQDIFQLFNSEVKVLSEHTYSIEEEFNGYWRITIHNIETKEKYIFSITDKLLIEKSEDDILSSCIQNLISILKNKEV